MTAHDRPSLSSRAGDLLSALANENRYRQLDPSEELWSETAVAASGLCDLSSNDYLGLRFDAKFQEKLKSALGGVPAGSGGSRLLGGDYPGFQTLEKAFAAFKKTESSLFFPSGYAANEAVAVGLGRIGVQFFSDQLNHASIVDGMRLSRGTAGPKTIVFPHRDVETLTALMEAADDNGSPPPAIVTESVFSMDGDTVPLPVLMHLAESRKGALVVDEAHAVGVLGDRGSGLTTELPRRESLIVVDTCGKALGVQGAFVSGPSWFRDVLINVARPFIYTTAPSPWLAAALTAALDYILPLDERRSALRDIADEVRTLMAKFGLNAGLSSTHIIPVITGSETSALSAAAIFRQHGLIVRAIRPPTVPPGTARLRISLRANLTLSERRRLKQALEEVARHVANP